MTLLAPDSIMRYRGWIILDSAQYLADSSSIHLKFKVNLINIGGLDYKDIFAKAEKVLSGPAKTCITYEDFTIFDFPPNIKQDGR